jgi:hypothetical protein
VVWAVLFALVCVLVNVNTQMTVSPLQEFDDARDADDAVYELNGKDLCGERYNLIR